MTEPIKPALTPEQWALAAPQFRMPFIYDVIFGRGQTDGEYRHAHAAVALHGQPFGFTREDVRALRVFLAQDEPVTEAGSVIHERLISLAARIEALLPPDAP